MIHLFEGKGYWGAPLCLPAEFHPPPHLASSARRSAAQTCPPAPDCRMNLNAPDPCLLAGRKDADISSPCLQAAGDKGTGYYGSKNLSKVNTPVHRQAQKIGVFACLQGLQTMPITAAQCANTITVCRRNGIIGAPSRKVPRKLS